MKKLIFILIVPLFLEFNSFKPEVYAPYCLSQSDAEKILGQPSALTERSTEEKDGIVKHRCTYTATAPDVNTNETGNLFYLFELYEDQGSAQKSYADLILSNQGMPGQKSINGIGEEAFFHSDQKNFHLMMVRRGNKIIRLKVNKVTSMTSLEGLQEVVRDLALTL